MGVTKRARFEVLRRDGHRCRYCGCDATERPLTVDHVMPVALGGADDPSNLVAACADCNSGKSSSSPDSTTVAQVADDAIRWAAAMKQAAAEMDAQREARKRHVQLIDKAWLRWNTNGQPIYRPTDWDRGIRSMLSAGLPVDMAVELVDVAMKSNASPEGTWRYFCGCGWRTVKSLQESASRIVASVATDPATSEPCGHCDVCTSDEPDDDTLCYALWPAEERFYEACEHCGQSGHACMWELGRQAGRIEGYSAGWDIGYDISHKHADAAYEAPAMAADLIERVIDGRFDCDVIRFPHIDDAREKLEIQIAEVGIAALVAAAAEPPF